MQYLHNQMNITSEIPIFKIENDEIVPIEWNDYAYTISISCNLSLKWIIARNLLELTRLLTAPSECQSFEKLWKGLDNAQMLTRKQLFTMQTIAVTVELTENFAAMCFAYAESVQHGIKYLPLLLRDFGQIRTLNEKYKGTNINTSMGNATEFFNGINNSILSLRKYLPSPKVSEKNRKAVITHIIDFRKKYLAWYNKFKHTNSILSFEAIFDKPPPMSFLHRIPDHLNYNNEKVTFKDKLSLKSFKTDKSKFLKKNVSHLNTNSFLTAFQNIDDIPIILESLNGFWQPIRAIQHKSLFGKDLPKFTE